MSDKPGCTTLAQLADLRAVQANTGRIWSIDFSERFEVPCVTKAAELVASGAIGRVVQDRRPRPAPAEPRLPPRLVLRPRRLWRHPDRHRKPPDRPIPVLHRLHRGRDHHGLALPTSPTRTIRAFRHFGEIALRSNKGHGYIRVDWFTPDALPTWGDGRAHHPRHRGLYRAAEIRRRGRARRHRSSRPRERIALRKHRLRATRACPIFARLIADIRGPDRNRHAAGARLHGDGTGADGAGYGRGARMIGVAIIGARDRPRASGGLPARWRIATPCAGSSTSTPPARPRWRARAPSPSATASRRRWKMPPST